MLTFDRRRAHKAPPAASVLRGRGHWHRAWQCPALLKKRTPFSGEIDTMRALLNVNDIHHTARGEPQLSGRQQTWCLHLGG